jgi:hypothetical protein
MRNNSQTTSQSGGQGTQSGTGQGQGAGTPWWQSFDWNILLLIFGVLSISFTLIFMGFESLRRRPKKNPPEQ